MKYFDEDETFLIQEIGFPKFNGGNINIRKDDNGNNIGMQLALHMDDRILQHNILAKIHGLTELKNIYIYLFLKLIELPEYNINALNNNGTTLLDNLNELGNSSLIDAVLELRRDICGVGTNKNIEELISDGDFLGIVDYCKNGTLMGNSQEVASGLYNIANQVGQYYNNNELAIKLYKESIKYNENDPTVYNNLATAYKRLGEYENSILYYNMALNIDLNNPIRYLSPAFLYAHIGQDKEAVVLLKKYFNIGGNDISFIDLCKNTTQGGSELLKLYNTF